MKTTRRYEEMTAEEKKAFDARCARIDLARFHDQERSDRNRRAAVRADKARRHRDGKRI